MLLNEKGFAGLLLERYPQTKDKTLRAWSAADEYLIEFIIEQQLQASTQVLIVNDQFGALTCQLANSNLDIWTDSYLSQTAIKNNLAQNGIDSTNLNFINQTDSKIELSKRYDLVIIRIPKHNSLLEFQLASLRPYIDANSQIIAAGMSKDIHKSNLKIFESQLGKTTTSLAKKKARLVFCEFEPCKTIKPVNWIKQYHLETPSILVKGLPGVFSRDSLDMGARVLLDYLPNTQGNQKMIDLGCGTGVLGTVAAKNNSELELTFCDESWLATESARQTYLSNCSSQINDSQQQTCKAKFLTTDCLLGITNNQYDYVLCNPPFHQQNVQTLSIANQMFKQSADKLKSSGELRVVANRHLKYRPLLSSYFNQVKMISNHPKFVVWRAKEPKH